MRRQFIQTFLIISIGAPLLLWLFLIADPMRLRPIEGAAMITQAQLCSDIACTETSSVSLPFFSKPIMRAGLVHTVLQFDLDLKPEPGSIQAIYLPKFDDNIAITLNGVALRRVDTFERHWFKPLILSLPAELFSKTGKNRLRLTLTGFAQRKLILQPFYIGAYDALTGHYRWRSAVTVRVAQLGLGLMIVLCAAFAIIWIGKRAEVVYLYLAISCVAAAFICIQYGIDTSALPYRVWMIVWGYSTPVYVLMIAKVVATHLKIGLGRAEPFAVVAIVALTVIAIFVPEGWVHPFVIGTNLLTGFGAFSTCAWFWLNRKKASRIDFIVMFSCMFVAMLLGCNTLYQLVAPSPLLSLNLYQFMPFVMTGMCLWLIITALLRSFRDYEELIQSQHETISAKTSELEDSYRQLAQVERRKAIDDERKRIMLDLHDGLGGHLVNALAYMENKGLNEPTLSQALQDALRDLALMLDSLETEDSISTLLGMLRTRLENLLEDNGVAFVWEIMDEPKLAKPGPSQNLNLLRIVQEAITNVIKHASASSITVASDRSSVVISDNGHGFDMQKLESKHGGHGIVGMQRRAELIGARLQLSSSSEGTEIKLLFDAPMVAE